jgi:uncharacterized linocin/CFP29 family protein
MPMDLLKRKLAPILPEAWEAIDAEAARVLKLHLAGRKLVDFVGPFGWKFAAVNTGRLKLLPDGSDPELNLGIREVQPLVEIRVPIKLPIMELDQVARGATNPDLAPVVRAAEKIARAEDRAIFNGLKAAGIAGILPSSPHGPEKLAADVRAAVPRAVLAAKEKLRQAGVSGPYALVLGAELYDQVFALTEEGHPLAKRIEQLLVDHPIVRAPALVGGVVISLRGGDYELTVGQDLSVGYAYHDKNDVELYLTESFTFRVLEPGAAVRLEPA